MANENATTWGGKITLGRAPASGELLVGNSAGDFTLTPSSSIIPTVSIQALLDGISATQGAVLYRDATAWSALTPGTAGYVLQTAGANANPVWASPGSLVWATGVKTSPDVTTTNGTTLTNAADLFFSVAANTSYSFQFVLLISGAAGGFSVAITAPASPTALFYAVENNNSGQTVGGTGINVFATVPTTWATTVILNGFITNGATAGQVRLQFAQQVAGAVSTLRKGSWFQYRTV